MSTTGSLISYNVESVFPHIPRDVITEFGINYYALKTLLEGRYFLSAIGAIPESSVHIFLRSDGGDIDEALKSYFVDPEATLVCHHILVSAGEDYFTATPISTDLLPGGVLTGNQELHREWLYEDLADPYFGIDIHYLALESVRLDLEYPGSNTIILPDDRIVLLPSKKSGLFDIFRIDEKYPQA